MDKSESGTFRQIVQSVPGCFDVIDYAGQLQAWFRSELSATRALAEVKAAGFVPYLGFGGGGTGVEKVLRESGRGFDWALTCRVGS